MARIKEKRTAIVCPTIDGIDDKSLAYQGGGGSGYGIFTWYGMKNPIWSFSTCY